MKTAEEIVTEKFNSYRQSGKSFKQLAIEAALEYADIVVGEILNLNKEQNER